MWYLTEECSPLDVLISGAALTKHEMAALSLEAIEKASSPGKIYQEASKSFDDPTEEQWKKLSSMCCHMVPGAP
jgi:hypothetical protein